ncbi:hypothetical protein V8C42DRAFT_358029 [Trichoderma barbatum]
MSAKQDKQVASFINLPNELRLMIWETAIGSRVIEIDTNSKAEVVPTRGLAYSTATARAGLSVSRTDRYLIQKHLLPDEMPVVDKKRLKIATVQYNAAKDIIFLAHPAPPIFWLWILSEVVHRIDARTNPFPENIKWMRNVQKLALTPGGSRSNNPMDEYLTRSSLNEWFGGLKQLYVVCPPPDDIADEEDLADVEEDNSQDSLPQDTGLSAFMGMETTAPAPERNDDAFRHTGTYMATCSTETYLSGRAALEWLGSKRSKIDLIRNVEDFNTREEALHEIGPSEDLRVGILLHVGQAVERWITTYYTVVFSGDFGNNTGRLYG